MAWLPVLALVLTVLVAAATGCRVDEAAAHPCVVAGYDIGDALGTGLLMAFVAGPACMAILATGAVWLVLWRRRRPAAP